MAKKHKNLLTPTPKQVRYRNDIWAKALLKNERKARRTMQDKHGGRCCLQVAEDVAIACGLGVSRTGKGGSLPSDDVAQFFGWIDSNGTPQSNPVMKLPNGDSAIASHINDGNHSTSGSKGFSHRKIAEIVRNTFVRSEKKVKWTFNVKKGKKSK